MAHRLFVHGARFSRDWILHVYVLTGSDASNVYAYTRAIFLENELLLSKYSNIEIIMASTKFLKFAISNDSGVSHMLSTGYCPLIKLFGPKDSTKFTPENPNLFSISSSDFNSKNINKIPVSRVIEEIEKVLI